MAYIPVAVRRAPLSIRKKLAVAVVGVGLAATFAWTGFLTYVVINIVGP
jgi:hypothetical protein